MKVINKIEIKEGKIFKDEKLVWESQPNDDFPTFIRAFYKEKKLEYPKFYKMSDMCKLGYISSELAFENGEIEGVDKTKVAIILACSSSSLHADVEYSKTMNEIPSPAQFVYTLANIVTGEIAIRHGIKGEEMMFVQESFDKQQLEIYLKSLFDNGNAEYALMGYVDFDENLKYSSEIYLVKK